MNEHAKKTSEKEKTLPLDEGKSENASHATIKLNSKKTQVSK